MRSATNWIVDVDAGGEEPMAPVLDHVRPLLARLADVPVGDEHRDIVMMLEATDSGARSVIDPDQARAIAPA